MYESDYKGKSNWQQDKIGAKRALFNLETVDSFRQRFRTINSELLVFYGQPEDIIPKLVDPNRTTTLIFQRESNPEDVEIEEAVEKAV